MNRIGLFFLFLTFSAILFSVQISLKAQIMIESGQNQLLLMDFVENPDALKTLGKADIIFGYSPMPGRTMRVSVGYVLGKFKRYAPEAEYVLPEADIITIYRKALSTSSTDTSQDSFPDGLTDETAREKDRVHDEASIKNAIKKEFEQKLGIVFDEKLSVVYEQFPDTPQMGSLESIEIYSRGPGKYMARIEFSDTGKAKRYETAIFKASWLVMGLISDKLIRKDVLISQEYVSFEEIDYFDYKNPVLKAFFPDDYVADYNIAQGRVLEWNMLKKRSYVLKGQIIIALVQMGTLRISSQVQMLENGEIGQIVKARNIDSSIVITGIIESGPVLRVDY